MKNSPGGSILFNVGVVCIHFLLLIPFNLLGQQLEVKNFVVSGGFNQSSPQTYSATPSHAVVIGKGSSITGGSIGSDQLIKVLGKASIYSNLYSNGTIYLGDYTLVKGTIAAANSGKESGNVLKTGISQQLKGNIDVKGSVYIRSGSVLGTVTIPKGSSYYGPSPSGGKRYASPKLPILPQMPAITEFPKAGDKKITETQELTPNCYGPMELTGGKTITFSGTGTYVFSYIKNSGASPNKFIFDFKGDKTGVIKLYIHGDVDLNISNVDIINGGDASRIYAETHGTGNSCKLGNYAWTMTNYLANNRCSEWFGTIWAPYGGINIGSGSSSSSVKGALLSGTVVNIQCGVKITYCPFTECTPPKVNAGDDVEFTCPQTQVTLNGSCTTAPVQIKWTALNGGHIVTGENTLSPTVNSKGTYVLTATKDGCSASDTVIVTYKSCILPFYPPPVNGKDSSLIGAELTSLAVYGDSIQDPEQKIFVLSGDSVWVEVIAIEGQFQQLQSLLQTNEYGLTNLIDNGESQFIVSGRIPIDNLTKLNQLPQLINYCRPLFPPVGSAGITTSQGDIVMRTNYLRNGYELDGDSIKVGVLSDSYNTRPGNPAQTDVANGDLPGLNNSAYPVPVQVLMEFPFGRRVDEGRAMLQIIHDIAPKAQLAFRTGFISPGDLAQGILQLAATNCDVIVDDVTFITEPFFQDGVVSQAVDQVSAQGVAYFTSAGNFGNKSYQSVFVPATPPAGVSGQAHNFSGTGDVLQNISLQPGDYTIVLQWQDAFYSLGQTQTGTVNDLDIYLTDDNGSTLFGFNRNNLGGDPIEILPFTVISPTTTNILITRPSGTGSVSFKYIIFRGDGTINEYNSGNSTIVGQANAAGAFSIGAVRYTQTPAAGVNPPLIESFSSWGGTPINGQTRQKPDFTAPDGINTSINFDAPDLESDRIPNFFGTSAAAPHAAAVAALLKQARKKYYNQPYNNTELRELLSSTALDMNTPGFDFISGNGFIRADVAIQSLAAAKPELIRLLVPENVAPGNEPFTLTLRASYLSATTKVLFRDDTLATNYVNDSTATAPIPEFTGNPSIRAYTPSKSPTGRDGGVSNSITFFEIQKKNVKIKAENKIIRYGEQLPVFTSIITVDNKPLDSSGLTLTDLGLDSITYNTPATSTSNVNNYIVIPQRIFDLNNPVDAGFTELYTYTFENGVLSIEKMPLTITARDTTLTYGEKIGDISYTYQLPDSINLDDSIDLLDSIYTFHHNQLATDVIGLVNGKAVTIVNGKAVPIVNGQAVTIVNGQAVTIVNGKAVPIVNGQAITIVNGKAVPIVNNLSESEVQSLSFLATEKTLQGARQITNKKLVNGSVITQTSNVVDITQESVLDFNVNSAQTSMLTSITAVSPRGLIDDESFANKQAVTIVNGKAVAIVNGIEITQVNGQAVTIVNGKAVTIVNGQAIPIVNSQEKNAVIIDSTEIGQGLTSPLKSLNMITGSSIGLNYIIPGSLQNDNFDITYEVGKLTILPAALSIKANDTSKAYGAALKLDSLAFTISSGILMFEDSVKSVTLTSNGASASAGAGQYPIVPSTAIGGANTDLNNYLINYENGTLTVGKGLLTVKANNVTKVYGDPNPPFTATFTGFLNGDTFETSQISGQPDFTTTADLLSDAGKYPITVSLGSLSSPNYDFTFINENCLLTITQAPLTVKALDETITQKDPFPEFKAEFITLKANESPKVKFTVYPYYKGNPGEYAIIPLLVDFYNAKNYTINYENGTLYVNPDCPQTKKLRIYLDCVEEVKGSTYKYIAHFSCINPNSETVYLDKGEDNVLTSSGSFDDTQLPVVFVSGTTRFSVPFDGKTLTWQIKTIESGKKTAVASNASATSARCTKVYNNTTAQQSSGADIFKNDVSAGESLSVFPNPAARNVTVKAINGTLTVSSSNCLLYDLYGQFYPVRITKKISDSEFELDVSDLRNGLYYILVKNTDGYKTGRIIKE
ncbi:MBG domain-containing protein [Solitalea canadensis]|uniref:Subtilase family protease n=1 Tax=Solitalea canadensis (strain ATCC 29591 / DSM 3403 / JCM 21819 / LMG 8368 / NBRC 15130 / NCIMB 12057 / USAM 9D) TaxID=929556 RepID=H8KUL0_SOLCM|nr:MBG domain-containing protein [Solitalea canadensis]AFD07434.1 subtilase family protease [Solitalea canadensis DSM 3403]